MMKLKLCCLAAVFLVGTISLYAQEVQVPIDKESKIEIIDSGLEKKLKLFTDYENFREARLFMLPDSMYVLEISYKQGDQIVRARKKMSVMEADEFRTAVIEKLKQDAPQVFLNQEGRPELLAATTGLSMSYYGWAIPMGLEVHDGTTAGGLYSVISGLGFFVPYFLTENADVTDAEASFYLNGSVLGLGHGIALGYLLGDPDEETVQLFGVLGSVVEGFADYAIANRHQMSLGDVNTIGGLNFFGSLWGLGASHLIGFMDDADDNRAISSSILLGAGVGIVTGKVLTGRAHYSAGDATVLQTTGILSAQTMVTLLYFTDTEESKAYTATAVFGSMAGIAAGHALLRDKDFGLGHGRIVALGEYAGGALGMGIAYLVVPDGDDVDKFYTLMATLGSITGYLVTYKSFDDEARIETEEQASWSLNLSPTALLYSLDEDNSNTCHQAKNLINFQLKF